MKKQERYDRLEDIRHSLAMIQTEIDNMETVDIREVRDKVGKVKDKVAALLDKEFGDKELDMYIDYMDRLGKGQIKL